MANNLASLLSPGPTGAAGLSPLYTLGLKARGKIEDRQSLAQVCVEIEGVFISQLLEQMRKSMVRGLNSQKPESQQFQGLIDQHLARSLAAGGGLGLARRLYEDLAQRLPANRKEKQHGESATARESGESSATGDFPLPGAPGLSGTGSPSPGEDRGGGHPDPGGE